MSHQRPYNPLDKVNLGESIARAILGTRVFQLSKSAHLVGAGVYAIYYTGDFDVYEPIKQPDASGEFTQPIYVGKAIPPGARKGGLTFNAATGSALRDRLRQHASSIEATRNLEVKDFHCRALTVEDIWIPLGENVLIEKFQPLWNRVIDGFGNNVPGKGRPLQKRSRWDELHPGRPFALRLASNDLSEAGIRERVKAFFDGKLSQSEQLPLISDSDDV